MENHSTNGLPSILQHFSKFSKRNEWRWQSHASSEPSKDRTILEGSYGYFCPCTDTNFPSPQTALMTLMTKWLQVPTDNNITLRLTRHSQDSHNTCISSIHESKVTFLYTINIFFMSMININTIQCSIHKKREQYNHCTRPLPSSAEILLNKHHGNLHLS